MSKEKKQEFNFETAMQELTTLVETMESEQLDLEKTIKQFERGIQLTRNCQQALQQHHLLGFLGPDCSTQEVFKFLRFLIQKLI